MTKRFIVAVDNAAHPQRELRRERFIGYAKGKGLIWWNRVPSFWLMVDKTGRMTASGLDDDAHEIFAAPCVVIELRDDNHTWSGHGPKGMFEWLKNIWQKRHHGRSFFPTGEAGKATETPSFVHSDVGIPLPSGDKTPADDKTRAGIGPVIPTR